jgi:A/G-specific adenine glycosylase
MLQQTRVAAVIPYYDRFLERFPGVEALASASEQEVLTAWAGLGYYSRARNLHRAAKQIRDAGAFPREYQNIRELSGVGDYTAAAIASIAFDLPYPVLDGNAARVLSRMVAEQGDIRSTQTRQRLTHAATELMDERRPGDFNQAIMELGATICIPKQPECSGCPVASYCEARRQGLQHELPINSKRAEPKRASIELLIVERRGKILLRQRPPESKRMAGFWELPEASEVPAVRTERIGSFRHTIVNTTYEVGVLRGRLSKQPAGYAWIDPKIPANQPITTATRKALACRPTD